MTNGDKMRMMDNKELALDLYIWKEDFRNGTFKSLKDIENYLNQEVKPENIHEAAMDELFD